MSTKKNAVKLIVIIGSAAVITLRELGVNETLRGRSVMTFTARNQTAQIKGGSGRSAYSVFRAIRTQQYPSLGANWTSRSHSPAPSAAPINKAKLAAQMLAV